MQLFQGPITSILCLSLLIPAIPDPAQAPAALSGQFATRPAYQSTQLQGDERILHALNRFTFGPRPGDLETVRSIGLEKWFDQQLHPASLPLTDLNARLAQYPAMQWNTQDLLFRFPSNAIIRQTMDGKFPAPEHGVLSAVYQNQADRVASRKHEQEQKKALAQTKQDQAAPPLGPAVQNGATMDQGAAAASETTSTASESAQASSLLRAAMSDSNQMDMSSPAAQSDAPSVDESQIRFILDLPPQQRIAQLASMPQPDFDSFTRSLRPLQRAALVAGLAPEQKETVIALANPQRVVNEELIAQRLTRDIDSPAQLQEVMTDFWLNHFNVYLHKNDETPYYLVSYERDVIRPLALGKFEDLLEATAHSPAMLLYLDNATSMGPDSPAAERAALAAVRNPTKGSKAGKAGLNENYARELMELHTLGVNGGYTQADVTQVARILTGWTVDRPQRGGGFQFDPRRHEPGAKKVLGKKFKENGEQEGRQLLHLLATRPATAHFISRKLAVRFVSDDPPQSLVDRMAKSYLSSGGDIAVVLRTLFHSPEFWSTSAYRAKVKTPIEFVVSAARAGNAGIDNLQPLANALRQMGMPLYGCVTPNGYSWDSTTWVSTNALVNRMNFALNLAGNRLPGVNIKWNPIMDAYSDQSLSSVSIPMPYPKTEELRLESTLLGDGVSDSTRAAVLQQFFKQTLPELNAAANKPLEMGPESRQMNQIISAFEKQDQVLAGLLLGSPEFQRR